MYPPYPCNHSQVMEPDHPSPGESETAASEDRSGSNSNTRTYDCTFCKRGFSSAQALGGHMNIHRKDRAKIKHPSNFGQLSLDIPTKIVPSYPTALTSHMSQLAHGGNDGSSPKWQRNLPREEVQRVMTHECAPRQLSLFGETQAGAEDHPSSSSHEWKEEERSGHERGAVEVDLELRLGMEPHDATMSRKEFF